MPSLSRDLRNQLARVTLEAREVAERACRAALENLAVHEKEYRGHMSVEQRQLRNRLRARGRALGDQRDQAKGTQEIRHLAEDAAYENWHRLLFTRFLAENNLLHTSAEHGNVPVTLQECEELASELGAKDGFDLACKFAAEILPGVFRSDDPVFEVSLAQRDVVELRGLLDSLPSEVFTADDSLGWTYQFWQAKRKDEVNASGNKIGADELSPVTQLFTEDYMVEFLLHNTLGAWWAGKLGPIEAGNEAEAREKAALPKRDGIGLKWTYLRFVQDEKTKTWSPAAGSFEGWPKRAAEIKFLDPCMGSGHFPVFALPIIARLRMEDEGMNAAPAIHATLQDNIHGLELDPRCCQIGAFNLALTAWKLGGYQALPQLQVACCGIAPQAQPKDWVALAGENEKLQRGMERLYSLFKNAPVLGSLINPRSGGDLLVAQFHELQPLLEKALAQETKDDTAHEMAVTARGLAKAAEILAGQFTLIATNVPYLGRGKQDDILADYCERLHPTAKGDLATCFVERCLTFCADNGSTSLVTPQNWLFLGGYQDFRTSILREDTWILVARLGPNGFSSIGGEVVQAALPIIARKTPSRPLSCFGIDASSAPGERAIQPEEKAILLRGGNQTDHLPGRDGVPRKINIDAILASPGAAFSFAQTGDSSFLCESARSFVGLQTGDSPKWIQRFWEQSALDKKDWWPFQLAPEETRLVDGCVAIVRWGRSSELAESPGARVQGLEAWGKRGVLIQRMSSLKATLYHGQPFDTNTAAVVPVGKELTVAALFAFCSAPSYSVAVRDRAPGLSITNQALVNIPFPKNAFAQTVSTESLTLDPTQWLFNGHPAGADQSLQVAVSRLLGYQWPRQTGSNFPDCPALKSDGLEKLSDDDGIVCLPPLNREQPAAARLRNLLAAALGHFDERALLNAAEAKKKTLEDWLRDEFFEQHCALFHHRPFIWHIWDGRKDGFSALVNYHRLNHANLQKLTYAYLGSWINDQEAAAKADTPGAAERLLAAQELQKELAKILEGEPPYDIFVRWKPLAKQARGWNPDINDGVRLNIRPFLLAKDVGKKGAGILRSKPNIKWDKDRGKEPQRPKNEYPWFWCDSEPGNDPVGGKTFAGHRWNNVHLTLAYKGGATS